MKQTCRCSSDSLLLQLQSFCSQLDCIFDSSVVFTDTVSDWHHNLLSCGAPGHVDSEISPSSMWKDSFELITTLVWLLRQRVKVRFRGDGIDSELGLPHKPHLISSEVAPTALLTPRAATLYFFTSVAVRRLLASLSAAAALIGKHKRRCHTRRTTHRLIHARLDHSHAA